MYSRISFCGIHHLTLAASQLTQAVTLIHHYCYGCGWTFTTYIKNMLKNEATVWHELLFRYFQIRQQSLILDFYQNLGMLIYLLVWKDKLMSTSGSLHIQLNCRSPQPAETVSEYFVHSMTHHPKTLLALNHERARIGWMHARTPDQHLLWADKKLDDEQSERTWVSVPLNMPAFLVLSSLIYTLNQTKKKWH